MAASSDSPRTVRALRDLLQAHEGPTGDATTSRASAFGTVQLPGAWRTGRVKVGDRSRRPSAKGIFAGRDEAADVPVVEQLDEWELPDETGPDAERLERVDAIVDRVFFQVRSQVPLERAPAHSDQALCTGRIF